MAGLEMAAPVEEVVGGAACRPGPAAGTRAVVVAAAVAWVRATVVPQAMEAVTRRPVAAMAARSARQAVATAAAAVATAAAAVASATTPVGKKGGLEEAGVVDGVVCYRVAAWEERWAAAAAVGFWVAVVASAGATVGATAAVERATAVADRCASRRPEYRRRPRAAVEPGRIAPWMRSRSPRQ